MGTWEANVVGPGAGDPARTRRRSTVRAQLARWQPRPTVLVIEDDPAMRELLIAALHRAGHRVIAFANGDDALTWLGPGALDGDVERVPAAIVCDIRIPYFSGLEILSSLRLAADRIPTILITAFPDEGTREEASRLGATCLLEKPFALDALCAAVRQAVAGAPPSP